MCWLCSSGVVLCCLCVFGVLGFCGVLWFVSARFSCAVMFLGCLGCCVLVCSVVSGVLLVFAGFLCLLFPWCVLLFSLVAWCCFGSF